MATGPSAQGIPLVTYTVGPTGWKQTRSILTGVTIHWDSPSITTGSTYMWKLMESITLNPTYLQTTTRARVPPTQFTTIIGFTGMEFRGASLPMLVSSTLEIIHAWF